jgi:dihydrofolate synthase/folylpolyglutamate synthase
MTDSDEVFFAEWRRRRPGRRRDIRRAGELARVLGIATSPCPVLAVVGSKGKGTAATYASATLAGADLRTVTVTSPALRSNTERIRVDGRAVTPETLRDLGARLRDAIPRLGTPDNGYLSPSGLFLLAGVRHAADIRADALVLEAGMGGRSDEISLFPPDVLAICRIFAEHIGVLGDTTVEIAHEKASVAGAATRAVLSLPQTEPVAEAIAAAIADHAAPGTEPHTVRTMVPAAARPAGLSAANADLGYRAALTALDLMNAAPPKPGRLDATLRSIVLPGRLSWHRVDETEVLVDAAISRPGMAAALTAAGLRWGGVDHVFVCLPDHKDVRGAVHELGSIATTFVRMPGTHLSFRQRLPETWRVIDIDELGPADLSAAGRHVAVLGTGYFTGRVLDVIDAPADRLFTVADA